MGDPARTPDDDERMELIDGVATPKQRGTFEHGNAQSGVVAAIARGFHRPASGSRGGWWIATEAEAAYGEDWVFLHDIAGWRRDGLPLRPSGRAVREVPDWVCEILSTNRRHDVVTKLDVLGRAGVRHYWLIDVDARELVVHRLEASGWLRVAAFVATTPGEKVRVEPFDSEELELGVLLGDDPTELRFVAVEAPRTIGGADQIEGDPP